MATLHFHIGHFAGALPRAKPLRKRRDRRLQAVRPSHRNELWYRAELNGIVDHLRRAGREVLAALKPLWPADVTDARRVGDKRKGEAPGAGELDKARGAFRNIGGVAVEIAVGTHSRDGLIKRNLDAVDDRLAVSVQRSAGVEIRQALTQHGEIANAMADAVEANVALITSIPDQYFDQLGGAIADAWQNGDDVTDLADAIEHVGDVAESRAALIARDQTSKLNSAFNRVRQTSIGIERYRWDTAEDERVRDSHAALDGQSFSWDDPPTVDGEKANPGEPINCFPGDSEIQFAHDVKKAYRRRYGGELAEIVTESGKTLRATPNHPVLTARGWLPIGSLNEGDHVIEVADEVFQVAKEHQDDRVPLISDVFEAAAKDGGLHSADLRVDDFHGDGTDGEVDVVFAARLLTVDTVTRAGERDRQLCLAESDDSRSRLGAARLVFRRVASAAYRIVGGFREFASFVCAQSLHPQSIRLGAAAALDAGFVQAQIYRKPVDSEASRNRQDALAFQVRGDDRGRVERSFVPRRTPGVAHRTNADLAEFASEVVVAESDDGDDLAERLPFAHKASRVLKASRIDGWVGHVYNLETAAGWYVTNGIVTHNCRCVASPLLDLEDDSMAAEGALEAEEDLAEAA